jgi:hypothetical protein
MSTRITSRSNLLPYAAFALTVSLVFTAVHFGSSLAVSLTQAAGAQSAQTQSISPVSASRKVRCIMPPALRTHCDL